MADTFNNDNYSSDKDGYKSPSASVDNDPTPWGPFSKRKIPLDDFHTCPCCNGKGYVGIVNEREIKDQPRRKRRDILGNLID